jgi:replicative DNA helicase
MSTGFKPDIILVDYADLLRSIEKSDARYQELGAIYEELRGLAGEYKLPCWTASQTQRSSIQDDVIQADKIAESYSKIMTADVVISLSRKLEDKQNHTGRAHIIKNRFGADGQTLPVFMNTSIGKIEIYDDNSTQGIILKKQMQSSEGLLKKTLADRLRNMPESDDILED